MMRQQRRMRSGLLLVLGFLLFGCATVTDSATQSAEPERGVAAKGWVLRINRSDSSFDLKLKNSEGTLTINYDPATNLLNFKDMIEITKEQPLEVIYQPGGKPVNRAISLQKLPFDGCQ